jgi:hypothetical protein
MARPQDNAVGRPNLYLPGELMQSQLQHRLGSGRLNYDSKMLIAFLATLPLQWLALISAGPLAPKLPHLFAIALALGLLSRGRLAYGLKSTAVTGYVLLFTMYAYGFLSLIWSSDRLDGASALVRDTTYVSLSFLIALWIARCSYEQLSRVASVSTILAVPLFMFFAAISLLKIGVNPLKLAIDAISSGNPNAIQYYLFRKMFNGGSLFGGGPSSVLYSAANRHAVMLAFVLQMSACLAMPVAMPLVRRLLLVASIVTLVALVLVSLSRSAWAIALACALVYASYFVLRRPRIIPYLAIGGVVILTLAIAFVSSDLYPGLREILYYKFYLDIINNPRAQAIAAILGRISEDPILGKGFGTQLNIGFEGVAYAHNLVLHFWHQCGIIGFALSMLVIVYLLAIFFRLFVVAVRSRDYTTSRTALAGAMLLTIPILRFQVAIGGGLSLPEWTAFAISVALYSRVRHSNRIRLARRPVQSPARQAATSGPQIPTEAFHQQR